MANDNHYHHTPPPGLNPNLSVPAFRHGTIGRADVLGTSPMCVGNRSQSMTNQIQRGRSPSRLSSIGIPLYGRSRSASPSCSSQTEFPIDSPPRARLSPTNEELKNLARQPSNSESVVPETEVNDPYQTYGSCACTSNFTPHMEDAFRRKLKFYFMNPCQKWRAKRRFPYKLCLQVLKIVIVTMQLMYFGSERSSYVDFLSRNSLAFKHLYVYNWDYSFETLPYPPATGEFAVYKKDDILDGIDHTMSQYNLTKIIAIGSYDFANIDGTMPPPEICVTHYAVGEMWPHNMSYSFNADIETECYNVTPVEFYNPTSQKMEEKYDIRQFFNETGREINFDRLNFLDIKFNLKSIHLRVHEFQRMASPVCLQFNITVRYDNTKHTGQVPVILKASTEALECRNKTLIHGATTSMILAKRTLDALVIIICTISFFLCLRTLRRSRRLRKLAVHFFKFRFNRKLSAYEQCDFLNLWDVLILINDILTVSGTIVKVLIELRNSDDYEVAGMLLGVGSLLVWLGVLRYLSFFEHYNILILTMKQAIPDIGRFLVCASVLYLGFAFCGWVVLGPYHIKFATISQASECLFALVNGDEIFVTYADTLATNNYVYYFSRVYLYLFISLFMYVVYSLFTSIIITTYETIKFYYREGFPKGVVQSFIEEHDEDETSPLFMADDRQSNRCYCCLFPCFRCSPCCGQEDEDTYPDEYTPLIN